MYIFRLSLATTLIALLPAVTVSAATYYVDGTNGKDGNTGTSTSSAFQTIQKCATVVRAGDICNIRAGTYRETIRPTNSGQPNSPISFQPYNGESVTISGADVVTGWSVFKGNIYYANVKLQNGYRNRSSSNTEIFANQIFVDEQMMIEARWPNTSLDLLTPTQASAGSGTTSSTIYDLKLPNLNWAGAKIHITGGGQWTSQTRQVTSSSQGKVSFSGASGDCSNLCSNPGTRYYLTNKLIALDSAAEWYYDGKQERLYLWTPKNDHPRSHAVEAKKRNYAFNLDGRNYINIKGLHIFAATISTDSNSHYNTIDGIKAKYVSHYVTIPDDGTSCTVYCAHGLDTGILVNGTNNTLKNSTIIYSAGNGVVVDGSNHTIQNNLIHDTDYAGTYNSIIAVSGNNHTLSSNTLYRTGRDGIKGSPTASRITLNHVYSVGMLTNDNGGFYTCCRVDGKSTRIDRNWFHDNTASLGTGIYIDNESGNFIIDHNVTWGHNGAGIRLNGHGSGNSKNIRVYNNTLDDEQSIASSKVSNTSGSQVVNNIFGGSTNYPARYQSNLGASINPLFINVAARDYHLQKGSPAIDTGQIISGITDGYVGSAPNMGAYEYGGSNWGPPGCNFNGCSPPADSGSNLVNNPGFESGALSSWTTWDNARVAVTTSTFHSGAYAVRLTGADMGVEQVLSGLTPNTTYKFSGWAKVANSGDVVWIGVKDFGGTLTRRSISSTSYIQVSLTFTTGPNNTSAKIYLYKPPTAGTGDAYGDDFILLRTGSASSSISGRHRCSTFLECLLSYLTNIRLMLSRSDSLGLDKKNL